MSFHKSFSEVAPAYTPAMMKYDGSSRYSKASVTTAGNKLTYTGRVKVASFTNAWDSQILFRAQGPSQYRIWVGVVSSDHVNTDWRNKLQFAVVNSSGTLICYLTSTQTVANDALHGIFINFDGDAGTAVFKIDGTDADNTGATGRVAPTTGTLDTGATTFYVGVRSDLNAHLTGDMGYVGYRDAILTWSDFFDASGNPKALDESTWTEWGAQPLLWNEHGEMDNNLGSAGGLTVTGTVVVGKGGN